jgi:hypothetical protein
MNGRDSIQSLLVLRKLTRAITDVVRAQMVEYLATLSPLFRPTTVLGDYVQGGHKEMTRKADKAFKQLQTLYDTVATAKPFNLPRELTLPLNFPGDTLEITPHDYIHVAHSSSDAKPITVRAPLTWALTYTGYAPSRLHELVNTKLRSIDEVQKFVLSYLILHVVTQSQPGLLQVLEALHFPLTTSKLPDLGDLPITRIGINVATTRPSDAVVRESAELTGMDAFEEIVSVEDLGRLRHPLKDRLLEIARQHAPELV